MIWRMNHIGSYPLHITDLSDHIMHISVHIKSTDKLDKKYRQTRLSRVDKDAMARTLKAVAPACKAVGSTFEAWIAPEHVDVRPSVHPNRVEAIVVSVQSKEGSWFVTATFDRDGDGKPRSPSAPVVCWNAKFEGRYGNLYM